MQYYNRYSRPRSLRLMSQQKTKTDTYRPHVKQTIKVIGRTIFCARCDEEVATYYCPCGVFLCTIDFVSHNCTNTLKETYYKDLIQALR